MMATTTSDDAATSVIIYDLGRLTWRLVYNFEMDLKRKQTGLLKRRRIGGTISVADSDGCSDHKAWLRGVDGLRAM